jgi:hypothetical protein
VVLIREVKVHTTITAAYASAALMPLRHVRRAVWSQARSIKVADEERRFAARRCEHCLDVVPTGFLPRTSFWSSCSHGSVFMHAPLAETLAVRVLTMTALCSVRSNRSAADNQQTLHTSSQPQIVMEQKTTETPTTTQQSYPFEGAAAFRPAAVAGVPVFYPHPPFAPAPPAFSHSSSIASLAPSVGFPIQPAAAHPHPPATVPVALPRGNLSLKERVALDNLVAHHANLRRAAPAIRSWSNQSAHITLANNHSAAVRRNQAMKQAEIARQNSQMVTKITETVIQGKSPYGYRPAKTGGAPFVHRSLNLTQRKTEQARIAAANLQLAKRIIGKKAEVGQKSEWNKHAAKQERIRAQLSRFVEIPQTMQQQMQQQQPYPAQHQQFDPSMIPPGYTMESYIEALQQLQIQQAQASQQQYAAAGGMGFMPTPPSQPRDAAPSGGPLAPLPDAEKRHAKYISKVMELEKHRLGEKPANSNLLRPLRRRSAEAQHAEQLQMQIQMQLAALQVGQSPQTSTSSKSHSRVTSQQLSASPSSSSLASPARSAQQAESFQSPSQPLTGLSGRLQEAAPAHSQQQQDGSAPAADQAVASVVVAQREEPLLVLRKSTKKPDAAELKTSPADVDPDMPTDSLAIAI